MPIVNLTQVDVDNFVSAINNRAKTTDVTSGLATKQNTLVAGTNISIVGNTISANDTAVGFAEITSKPTTLSGYGITDASLSTHTHPVVTTTTDGLMAFADKVKLNTVSGTNTGDQTTITGNAGTATVLQTARTINGVSFNGSANITINAVDSTARIASTEKGVANGVATLDGAGLIPSTQLPAYVDDVLEFATLATFPATGVAGKIYVDLATNKTYRWSGTVYVYITSGAVDSVAGKTGVVTLVKADVGLGNVDNTTDLLKPISTATQTALNGKVDDAQVLTNVPAGALFTDTVYTHPVNHPASIITQDASNRFVTDTEKATWNAKASTAIATTTVNGLMSATDKVKLDASVNYVLPTATASVLGGVKSGTDVTIDANGLISVTNDSHQHTFANLLTKPTTIAGYGITDAVSSAQLTTLQNQVDALDSNAISATLITANATLVAGTENIVVADTLTITLPASPTTGMKVELLDGTSANTSTTISGNGSNIEGATTYLINTPSFDVKFVYINATYGWRAFGF